MTDLDTPVRASLLGPHSAYAVWSAGAVRYDREMSPFAALPPEPGEQDWAGLAALSAGAGDGGGAAGAEVGDGMEAVGARAVLVDPPPLPPGWQPLARFDAVQMVGPDSVVAQEDPQVVRLGRADLDEVLDLVRRTEPGPFGRRTMELGDYLGIRVDGRLAALTGERMHPPGWTEVSAVCTDPAYRGRGLAARLVRAVTAGVLARGEGAFLHVIATNAGAISVYAAQGFRVRRAMPIVVVRPPVPEAR